MKSLKKISLKEVDESTQTLSRGRMKAIKGGGGNCYVYCGGYNSSSMTIASSCSDVNCGMYGVKYCTCQ